MTLSAHVGSEKYSSEGTITMFVAVLLKKNMRVGSWHFFHQKATVGSRLWFFQPPSVAPGTRPCIPDARAQRWLLIPRIFKLLRGLLHPRYNGGNGQIKMKIPITALWLWFTYNGFKQPWFTPDQSMSKSVLNLDNSLWKLSGKLEAGGGWRKLAG